MGHVYLNHKSIFFKESRQESRGSNNCEYLKGLSLKRSFGPMYSRSGI